MAIIKKTLREKEENDVSLASLIQPSVIKPFIIGFIMFVFLNLSGLNIMIFYCNSIFFYSGSSLIQPSVVYIAVSLFTSFLLRGEQIRAFTIV